MNLQRVMALCAGFALDACLGDPQEWPHPVRLIGKQIDFGERLARERVLPACEAAGLSVARDQAERLAGGALALSVASAAPLATALAIGGAAKASPVLSTALEAFVFYQLIAARSLSDAALEVHGYLQRGDVEGARHAVSMIVGRDTDALDEAGIARATVETVAENVSDGVVAPLLYMGLGGAPAAMMYKAVNTLDSMVGYKNERYLNLGRASAKLDDALNVVPARVSGVLMCAAAKLAGFDARRAWRTFKRDRYNHSSPNSAHTEAACAGALGVQLGGANRYFGKVVEKPAIGDDVRPIRPDDIPQATKLMYLTSVLGLALAAALACASGAGARR